MTRANKSKENPKKRVRACVYEKKLVTLRAELNYYEKVFLFIGRGMYEYCHDGRVE